MNDAVMIPNVSAPTEAAESRLVVRYGFQLARELEIGKVLVLAELLIDRRLVDKHREKEALIWVTADRLSLAESGFLQEEDRCIEIPVTKVDRMGRVRLALVLAVMQGTIGPEESVICLTGLTGSKRLDNILIANPARDFPWFGEHLRSGGSSLLATREFVRLFDIATKFAAEGREGKPIGTIFMLGDAEELKNFSKPLILNPCEGHPRKSRNIHDDPFVESMRELAALDGGFIIDRKGVVEQAGVYFDGPLGKNVNVEKGLGARHLSAAAVTAKADALAIVISESSGTVTVFSRGSKLMSLGGRGGGD